MATGTSTTIRLDLLDVPKQHRARRWRDLLDGFYFKSEYSIPDDFRNGRLEGFQFDGFTIGSFASDPIAGVRTTSHLARNPVDAYLVVLAGECPITLTQGGQVVRVDQRRFTLISAMEPSSFHQLQAGAQDSIMVPGELMRRFAPRIDERMALPFGHEPLQRLFHSMATEWARGVHVMDPAIRAMVGTSIVELLGLVVDGADQKSAESVVQLAHRRGIERIVREGYADPALGPASIAKRMNLSPRRIRSILAAHGTTLGRLIRERRVAEALRLCRFDASPRRSPQAVASAVGYSDVRRFYGDMEMVGGHRPSQLGM